MEKEASSQKGKAGLFERISGIRHTSPSDDEIVEALDDAGSLDDDEKRMIREIISLGDAAAGEICTPRVDVMFVEENDSARVALERMRGTGYSRLPVFRDDIDEVVGIVHYKDLIGPLMDGTIEEPVSRFAYEAMFVPETKDVMTLLGEMQSKHQQMAIVVDEYGGTEGVVTVEDILEEIVGEIGDESDIGAESIRFIEPGVWRVEGRFSVEDARELGWPVEDSDDYETIAGWILEKLDSVPVPGDSVEHEGYRFTVERMRRSRISSVRVDKL